MEDLWLGLGGYNEVIRLGSEINFQEDGLSGCVGPAWLSRSGWGTRWVGLGKKKNLCSKEYI